MSSRATRRTPIDTGAAICPAVNTEELPAERSVKYPSAVISRAYGFLVVLAVVISAAAVAVAVSLDLPLKDPDGAAGPTYFRLPAIIALCLLLDVLPRAIRRAGGVRGLRAAVRDVFRERWSRHRLALLAVGLGAWYATYVAFRNLKSFVPFVRDHTYDLELLRLDRELSFGHNPATWLHDLLGTGAAAHILSGVYIAWIVLLPLSLGAALVWTRDIARGSWYVTAIAVDWVLGAAAYYLLPSLGPVYVRPGWFSDLPPTGSSQLADTLLAERLEVLANPYTAEAVQTIAAFASLHVGICVTAALIAHRAGMSKLVRWGLWGFTFLTVLATVYLGWHYLWDAIAGAMLGAAGMWIGAIATGNHVRARPRPAPARRWVPTTG